MQASTGVTAPPQQRQRPELQSTPSLDFFAQLNSVPPAYPFESPNMDRLLGPDAGPSFWQSAASFGQHMPNSTFDTLKQAPVQQTAQQQSTSNLPWQQPTTQIQQPRSPNRQNNHLPPVSSTSPKQAAVPRQQQHVSPQTDTYPSWMPPAPDAPDASRFDRSAPFPMQTSPRMAPHQPVASGSGSSKRPSLPAANREQAYDTDQSSFQLGRSTTLPKTAASSATEAAKKKNWFRRIIDEVPDFMHVLSPTGVLLFASPSIQELAGKNPDELVGTTMADHLHPDDVSYWNRDFFNAISTGEDLRIYTRFRTKQGRYLILEVTGHAHYGETGPEGASISALTGSNSTTDCKCVFAVGRPYPSKSAGMLDNFLDCKMENERLKNKLRDTYAEIEAEGGMEALGLMSVAATETNVFSPPDQPQPTEPFSSYASSSRTSTTQYDAPAPRNHAITARTNESAAASANFLHADYASGLKGTSAAQKHKHANAGSAEERRPKKANTRRGDEGEFVCHDCGTVDSPEWRKGPMGPKTLCNACGLRWAKKSKLPKVKTGSGGSTTSMPNKAAAR